MAALTGLYHNHRASRIIPGRMGPVSQTIACVAGVIPVTAVSPGPASAPRGGGQLTKAKPAVARSLPSGKIR